jgi:hypothetical protein
MSNDNTSKDFIKERINEIYNRTLGNDLKQS